MGVAGRLFVVCGLVVVAQLLVIGIHSGTDPGPATLPKVGPQSLPEDIGDYSSRDEPLDEATVAAANADVMLNRVYENRLGDVVVVNVGIWTDYDRGIPHQPIVCYPSAGWEVASRRNVSIAVDQQQPFVVKQFVFQRDSSRIAVVFWVHLGDETITSNEPIRQILQRLRVAGGNRPPLVKVMLQTDAVDLEQANARLSRFAAALVPYTSSIR